MNTFSIRPTQLTWGGILLLLLLPHGQFCVEVGGMADYFDRSGCPTLCNRVVRHSPTRSKNWCLSLHMSKENAVIENEKGMSASSYVQAKQNPKLGLSLLCLSLYLSLPISISPSLFLSLPLFPPLSLPPSLLLPLPFSFLLSPSPSSLKLTHSRGVSCAWSELTL